MNTDNSENDDIVWLHGKIDEVSVSEEKYFCKTLKDQLLRGWSLLDARYYAYGRLLGFQSWSPESMGRR